MSVIKKVCNILYYSIPLLRRILTSERPIVETISNLYKVRRQDHIGVKFVLETNFINKPESYMFLNEYFERGMALNNYAFRDSLNKKQFLFKRIPDLMKRDYLVVDGASDLEIDEFINRNKKIAGKRNLSYGQGFKCYSIGEKNLSSKIREDKIEILEEWIEQHEEYAKINPASVNTIRIHTLRTTNGCKVCFYNQLSVGSKTTIHNMLIADKERYDIRVGYDGNIECAVMNVNNKNTLCEKHLDSGFVFAHGYQLPNIKEAVKVCLQAAEKVPEFRFIGWDIAFTPNGPIIVEGNVLSGSLYTQQIIENYINKKGLKNEVIKVFDEGMENIAYDKNCNLYAVSFADLSYLEKDNQPNALQQFLVLLESAVHNHGIVFFEVTEKNANCSIIYVPESNSLKLSKGAGKFVLELPKYIPENIYEADKIARNIATKVYNSLIEMG